MGKKLIMGILSIMMLILVGCSSGNKESIDGEQASNTETGEETILTVAAAASLQNVFTEIGEEFEKEENCKVEFVFGATGSLSEQITSGAPFDVMAAANVADIEKLVAEGFIIPETEKLYAIGRIGLVTLKDSIVDIKEIKDLTKDEIKYISIADPEIAPYGKAAKEAITKEGLWENLEPKIVYGKNIADALSLVDTGNSDVSIMAYSLKDDSKYKFILIEDSMHEPIKQAMGVTKQTTNEELSEKFIEFVKSEKGQTYIKKYGYDIPEE